MKRVAAAAAMIVEARVIALNSTSTPVPWQELTI
jgi:hypothetical protein